MSRLERVTLSQALTEELLEDIASGRLNRGDKVPTETQLMARFDVGRNTVREALQALKTMGIIDVRPGIGGVVKATTTSNLAKYLTLPTVMDDAAQDDLYDFRAFFETEIAARAAQCRTAEQLAVIRDRLREFEQFVARGESTSGSDVALHAAIAAATNNAMFTRVMDSISELLASVRERSEVVPGALETAVAEHAQIVLAIEEQDPDAARRAMAQHVSSGLEALRRLSTASTIG